MTLDSHDCLGKSVIDTLHCLESLGKNQYSAYVKNVLVERNLSIHEPIKKNNNFIFMQPVPRKQSKALQKMEEFRSDYSIFSRLFISSEVSDGNLDEFFFYKNHPCLLLSYQSGRQTKSPSLKIRTVGSPG